MTARTVAPLAADLEQGLKRLKLRRMRQLAPELLQTAKTQRWAPEELLRTLVEAEIAARDEANLHSRLRTAGFPQPKRLDDFQVAASLEIGIDGSSRTSRDTQDSCLAQRCDGGSRTRW